MIWLMLLALAQACPPCPCECPPLPGPIELPAPVTGRVVSVADGDTAAVLVNGTRHVTRLLAIDAPEAANFGKTAQPGSSPATKALKRLVLGKDVTLTADAAACEAPGCVDRYDRWLRYMTASDGRDVSTALVEAGYARAYMTGLLQSPVGAVLCQAEARARAEKRGIWKLRKNAKPSTCPKQRTVSTNPECAPGRGGN